MAAWSALPPDLLASIAERLEYRTDIINFRAVCQSWRNSVSLTLVNSTKILSPLLPYKGIINNHASILVASSVFLLQPYSNRMIKPWLVTVEEHNPGKLFIRAPLSRVIAANHMMSYTLDLAHFKQVKLGTFYNLRKLDRIHEMFSEKRLSEYDNKVVLFVNPNCGNSPTIDDCKIVELYNQIDHLSITRLKTGERFRVYFKGREFDDIVNFKGRVYAIDFQGRVCFMDYNSSKMYSITENPLPGCLSSNYKKRLAVLNEELYAIYRRCQISDYEGAFKVFMLKEDEKNWDEINGVGNNNILFVTFDGCFFASVKDFPGWKGNCIVFRRGSFPEYSGIPSFDYKIFEGWHIDRFPGVEGNYIVFRRGSFPAYSGIPSFDCKIFKGWHIDRDVADFPGWEDNCIVFRRGSFPEYSGIPSFDCKIFEGWHIDRDVADFTGWKDNCIVFRRGSFLEYSGIPSFDCKIFEGWHIDRDVA
ncbi:F-box protein SKIP23, partial [Bienertia sinuspersici]